MMLPQPPLLLITDRHQARGPLEEVVAAALSGGCRWISLREKDLSHEARVVLLGRLVALGRARDATIMVHGDVEAAVAAGATGVHLPAHGSPRSVRLRLGAHALVGVSTHSRAEVEAAVAAGADYVSLSPIFASVSKPGYGPPLGLSNLDRIAQEFKIPILALGGISVANAGQCLAAGAAGVAVMGSVMRTADPADAIRRLIAALGSVPALGMRCTTEGGQVEATLSDGIELGFPREGHSDPRCRPGSRGASVASSSPGAVWKPFATEKNNLK